MNAVVDTHPPIHEPTIAQKEAGNYAKRKVGWRGMEISIENESGSFRRGTNRDGVSWEQRMSHPYGYLRETEGVDGDHVDVFVGPNMESDTVHVVHARKINRWDEYDEDKCMIGFNSQDEARDAFLANYSDPRFLGPITSMPADEFLTKVKATKDNPAMIKAEQLSLFASTVQVAGSVKKDGTVTKPYVRIQKVAPKPPTFEAVVRTLGGAAHIQKVLATETPDRIEAIVGKIADVSTMGKPEVRQRLGIADAVAADHLVAVPSNEGAGEATPAPVYYPRDGETKTEDGVDYVLREGHWHRATPLEDPNIDLAEDKQDLAEVMGKDPHSDAAQTLITGIAGKHKAIVEPDPVPNDDAPDDLDPNSPNYRYRDTGYVPGSRKELASEAIRGAARTGKRVRTTDVDWQQLEQNPREAKELITKSNLFGDVDWASLRDGGMEPGAGFLVDRVYASVGTEPSEETPRARQDFALGLETVRDRMERCKTAVEVTDVLNEIRDEMEGTMLNARESEDYKAARKIVDGMREIYGDIKAKLDASYQEYMTAKQKFSSFDYQQSKRLRRKWKPDPELQAGIDEWKPISERLFSEHMAMREGDPKLKTQARMHPGGGTSYDNDYEFAIRTAGGIAHAILQQAKNRNLRENPITRAWMTLGERFMKAIYYRSYKGSDTFASHVTSAKTGKIKDWSWSEKSGATGTKSTKREIGFQLKVAENFSREGGRDMSAESTAAFKTMFGLRDVQSGNWVLNDPNSAKFHITQATHAFADLADIVGAPDSLVSMNGRLALAFGARGSGNAGFRGAARAHYEPVHRIINLTKMGGGGCLGHEWFHAMDNLVIEAETGHPAGSDVYLTENPDLLPAGELRDAFAGVRDAILTGDKRLIEYIAYSDKDFRTARYNLERPHNNVTRLIKDAGELSAAVAAVDKYYAGIKAGYRGEPPRKVETQHKQWRRLAAAYYHGDSSGGRAPAETGPPRSSFAYEAVQLDTGETEKYWSKTRELAARAFQSWTEDTLAAAGRKNDYLSVFADNKHYVDPIFGNTYPFPEGEERQRINKAFDRLFAVVKANGSLAKAFVE